MQGQKSLVRGVKHEIRRNGLAVKKTTVLSTTPDHHSYPKMYRVNCFLVSFYLVSLVLRLEKCGGFKVRVEIVWAEGGLVPDPKFELLLEIARMLAFTFI